MYSPGQFRLGGTTRWHSLANLTSTVSSICSITDATSARARRVPSTQRIPSAVNAEMGSTPAIAGLSWSQPCDRPLLASGLVDFGT